MSNHITKSLRSLDLNLLPILRELLYTKNVSRSAERLHMTQPAVSDALKRIRLQFQDKILVRVGRNLVATPLAESLVPELEHILGRIEALSENTSKTIDSTVERDIVIATGDNIITALGVNLFQLLLEKLPKVHLQFLYLQDLDVRQLKTGDIDMAILPKELVDDKELKYLTLYSEDFVCISRKNHPILRGSVRQKELKSIPKIGFRADQHSKFKVSGLEDWDDHLSLPGILPIPYIVEQSNSIAIIQRHMAEHFSQHLAIDIHEVVDFNWNLEIGVFWGEIYDHCNAHTWLRNQLKDLFDQSVKYKQ